MTRIFRALTPKPATPRGRAAAPRQQVQTPDAARPEAAAAAAPDAGETPGTPQRPDRPKEHGGPDGPEPTRYGDWERGGICYDF